VVKNESSNPIQIPSQKNIEAIEDHSTNWKCAKDGGDCQYCQSMEQKKNWTRQSFDFSLCTRNMDAMAVGHDVKRLVRVINP